MQAARVTSGACSDEMIDSGIAILSVFDGHPNIELVFVMMIIPFTLNSLQYWIQDSFLAGTEFIQTAKKNAEEDKNEMKEIYLDQ